MKLRTTSFSTRNKNYLFLSMKELFLQISRFQLDVILHDIQVFHLFLEFLVSHIIIGFVQGICGPGKCRKSFVEDSLLRWRSILKVVIKLKSTFYQLTVIPMALSASVMIARNQDKSRSQ